MKTDLSATIDRAQVLLEELTSARPGFELTASRLRTALGLVSELILELRFARAELAGLEFDLMDEVEMRKAVEARLETLH